MEEFRVISLSQSACSKNPSASIPGNEKERRSFDFFRFQTLQELEIALESPDWNRLILQASHSSPVIRQAAIALGSLGERFYIHDVLTSDNDAANSCHAYARLQYQKALQGLRDHLYHKGMYTVDLTLMSCFLFICFEFMQGNEAGALVHLRSGLKILHGFLPKSNQVELARNGLCVSHSSPDPLIADIARVYAILDMQATMWLALSTFQAQGRAPTTGKPVCPTDVENFAGLDAANVSLSSQIGQMLYFCRSLPPEETWDPLDAAYVTAIRERERLMAQLDQWPIAIKALLLRKRNDLAIEDLQRVTVMSINHKITFMCLFVSVQHNEAELFYGFENIFEDILRLATSLLEPSTPMMNEKLDPVSRSVRAPGGVMPVFHFTAGIIQPVYFTAVKCHNRELSRRAISMLAASPWREGAWDSAAMAKIAERKVVQLEAEGWYDDFPRPPPLVSSADIISLGT